MDTLTNVVGILIIILILVQINVAESLRKIVSDLPEVSAEEFHEIQEEAVTRAEEHSEMQTQIEAAREQLQRDSQELEQLQPQLATVETVIEQPDVPLLDLEKLLEKLEETRPGVEALRKELDKLMKERQRLLALLEETPDTETPVPKVVRIPESRPIPKNAVLQQYLIHDGKIYHLDLDAAMEQVLAEMRRAGRQLEHERGRLDDGTRKTIYDQEKIVEYFRRRNLRQGDASIVISPNPYSTRLHLLLIPRENAGEPVERANSLMSPFLQKVRDYRGSSNVVWFLVLPDQFADYLAAREIVDELEIPAGWDVINNPMLVRAIEDFEVNRLKEPPPPSPRPTPDPDAIHIPAPTRQLD